MRFVSKSSNLRVMLESGIAPNSLAGQPGRQCVSYLFVDGVVEVKEPEHIKKMLAHPDFNVTYIAVGEDALNQDPFEKTRAPSEPPHAITELKFGAPVGGKNTPRIQNFTPEIQRMIDRLAEEKAVEIAKKVLPELVKSVIEAQSAGISKETASQASKTETQVQKKHRGRPPKKTQIEEEPEIKEESEVGSEVE